MNLDKSIYGDFVVWTVKKNEILTHHTIINGGMYIGPLPVATTLFIDMYIQR